MTDGAAGLLAAALAGGPASLVPAPPWHYVGDFLVIEYWADPDAVAARAAARASSRLPTIPAAAPRCSSTGSRARDSGDELLDPVRGQYKEFFIVVNAHAGRRAGDDLPLHLGGPGLRARARVDPGVPQEAGLDPDDPLLRARLPGRGPRTFAGTLAANDRRLAYGTVTPERVAERAGRPTTTRRSSTSATSRGWPPAATTTRRCTSWCGRQPRPGDLGDPPRAGDARAVRGAERGAHRAGAGADRGRASASSSPTPSTTSSDRRDAAGARRDRHGDGGVARVNA